MLSNAIKFKKVFPRLKERDTSYHYYPNDDEWGKVEKVCEILKVFSGTTNIISGSDYLTSNLFLQEVCRIKVLLDRKSEDEDEFIRIMVKKMKEKFDKYWGDCNLLMSVAAVLDPRLKMRVIEYSFPKLYSEDDARSNIVAVRDALFQLYGEYATQHQASSVSIAQCDGDGMDNTTNKIDEWDDWTSFINKVETVEPSKFELDLYLGEGVHKCQGDCDGFDALIWWQASSTKYPILSKMAREILAIPITTVASESTFSARSRVIDTYRLLLAPDTVQMLLCGGDWCHHMNGVKKGSNIERQPLEIDLAIPPL